MKPYTFKELRFFCIGLKAFSHSNESFFIIKSVHSGLISITMPVVFDDDYIWYDANNIDIPDYDEIRKSSYVEYILSIT